MAVKTMSVWAVSWLLTATTVLAAEDAPLADAAEKMDRMGIQRLLEQSVDVNAPQVDGMTALHWVTLHDDLETARQLLTAGADTTAANRYGVTPLTLACTNGNGPLVELLLEAGADPNTSLPGGETALMTAARTGRLGPVEALLARGADVHAKVQGMGRQDGAGATKFLARMADPTIFDFKAKTEQTALVWAAAEGHADVVAALIEAGAEFQRTLESGFTPLLFAIRQGHAEVVRTLVEAGADVNRRIEPVLEWRHVGYEAQLKPGSTPLHVAVENGHFALATYLVDAAADPDAADPTGYTALHAIAGTRRVPLGDANPPPDGSGRMTSLDFVREMAARGANLNARMRSGGVDGLGSDGPGTTPLLMAVQTADVELVQTFAELGADPLVRSEDLATPLMLAGRRTGTEEDVLQTMAMLLELGVDINAVDRNGETAMHMAAYRNRADAIRFLASRGADIKVWNQENYQGWTPLAIAVGYRRGTFRPNPEAEAAVRAVMLAAGIVPPERVAPNSR
jgi:ankyrin repeat protein